MLLRIDMHSDREDRMPSSPELLGHTRPLDYPACNGWMRNAITSRRAIVVRSKLQTLA